MVPGFSGQKMLLKSNLSLASRSYTKMETEPEKECSTGGWWRWPWPPCPAPPLFALWVRPTSSPSWQSERGSAQPLGLPIVPGCQFMIQYKLQQRGSGNTVKLLSGKSPPMSKSLFSCLSGFNKHRLSLNFIGVKGTNCRSWNAMLLHFFLGHRHQSESAVALRRHESYCLLGLLSHTTARASCCFQQLWITLKKLKGGTADNMSISLNQTNSLIVK